MRGFDVHTLFYSIRTHVNRPISGQNATQNGDLAFAKFASVYEWLQGFTDKSLHGNIGMERRQIEKMAL